MARRSVGSRTVSRRTFLKAVGSAGLLGLVRPGLAAAAPGPPLFEEVPPSRSGITWVHTNAMSPARYLPETLGPGCAFLDYDNDGWMDVYLVNSGPADFYTPPQPLKSALYHNNRDGTFTDVTDKAGVAGNAFGMGVAVGDYDNDGFPDMFVTAYGRCTLYHNNRDGTFSDVTDKAGLAAPGWTTSAAWFDYDNDGRLDLFVCSFVEYGMGKLVFCGDNKLGKRYYCIPRVFKPTPSLLFHNNGDGTFSEVSRGTDINRALGKALGVVATDVNNDGLLDLFVANDTVQNFLFMNRGQGKWEELGLASEVGFSANGQARSGMGVDAADFDGDGWQDLFVANVDQEMYSLYRNNHDESFADVARANEIAQATRLMSGWGLKFFDYDNDGNVDLLLASGHPDDQVESYAGQVHYKEPLLLFRNDGARMHDVSREAGPVFGRPFSARGLAVGDYDNDGRLEVLVANNGDAPLLLKNNAGAGNHWVGLKLQGTTCNRDAVGAVVTWSAGGVKRSRLKNAGGSYLSSHDPREVLGLGPATRADWIEVKWPPPSGHVERLTDVAADRYLTVVEGRGSIG
ncbi:MAG: CRTAC1 family protein [Acidobacteria bacterium]|nr:MAG: CRTAC1 family protein [Acidobacteriota bacterium]